jgi:hypothetical protein
MPKNKIKISKALANINSTIIYPFIHVLHFHSDASKGQARKVTLNHVSNHPKEATQRKGPTDSAIKHHVLHVFLDRRKVPELHSAVTPSCGAAVRCVTLNVVSCSECRQMGIIRRRHCIGKNIISVA